jgi:hypothetical protein
MIKAMVLKKGQRIVRDCFAPCMTCLLTYAHSKTACHPEPVEGSRAKAFAHVLRQAEQDSPFLKRHFIL